MHDFTGGEHNIFLSLVQLDGDDHKAHRKVLFQALGSNAISSMSKRIEKSAATQLQILRAGNGEID